VIQTLQQAEVGNVISYYFCHYALHGVNCQACVSSDLSFMYFGVVSHGSTNDNISYPNAVGLRDTVESLPFGMYCVADAAYTLQKNLLVPYTGLDCRIQQTMHLIFICPNNGFVLKWLLVN
jgi:hypothetical protein